MVCNCVLWKIAYRKNNARLVFHDIMNDLSIIFDLFGIILRRI